MNPRARLDRVNSSWLNNRSYWSLVAAMVCNQSSYSMLGVALPLLILSLTGSATIAGIIASVNLGVYIVASVFTGSIVDRMHASPVLRLTSLIQGACWLGVGLGLIIFDFPIWVIVGIVAVCAVCAACDFPAEHSLIKVLVDNKDLGRANAVAQGRESAAEVLGTPLGGFIFQISTHLVFIVQGVLHIIGGLLVPRVRRTETAEPGEKQHFWKDAFAGFAFVNSVPGLRGVTIVAAIGNFPMAAFSLVLIAQFESTGMRPIIIGMLSATFGLGVVVGSFFVGWCTDRFTLGTLGIVAITAFSVCMGVIALVYANPWIVLVALFLAGIPLPAFNSAIGAYTAAVTPEEMMGRVTTATSVPGMFFMPLGIFFAGYGFDHFGTRTTMTVIFVLATLCAVLMVSFKDVRNIPKLVDLGS